MNVVIDNDIVYKGVCYGILQHIIQVCDTACSAVGILGAARFVVAKKVRRAQLNRGQEPILQELALFLSAIVQLEPTEEEQILAADLESSAQRLGVSFDAGESQLCAIAIRRAIPTLITGDKRAIAAMERILDEETRLQTLCGKVRCLEQAVSRLLQTKDLQTIRTAICNEPTVDKTLTICFICNSPTAQRETVLQGLESYINALRSVAARILAAGLTP